MKTTSIHVLTAVAAALLSACGGGGGSSQPAPVAPPSTTLSITVANQLALARAALVGTFSLARTTTVSTDDGAQAASAGAAGVLDSAVRAALAPLRDQRRGILAAGTRAQDAVAAPAETCASGGTRTATFDDRDGNSTTSEGDVLTAVFANCSSGGVVLDGSMTMTVNLVRADRLGGTMRFNDVKVTTAREVSTLSGQANVTEIDNLSTTDVEIVALSSLNVAFASPSYTDAFGVGGRISTSSANDGSRTTIELLSGGTVRSIAGAGAGADGEIAVSTTQPFIITPASPFPVSGQVRITNRLGNTPLLVTAVAGGKVELQLDANTDGTWDSDVLVDWTTLFAQ